MGRIRRVAGVGSGFGDVPPPPRLESVSTGHLVVAVEQNPSSRSNSQA